MSTDVSTYIHGKREGFRLVYTRFRHVDSDHMYKNDLLNGPCHMYYDSGRLMVESNYVNGLENGTRIGYKDSDKREVDVATDFVENIRTERRTYKKGKLVKTEKFDSTGKKVIEVIEAKKKK